MIDKWISVGDRLPDYGKNVLVFNGFVRHGYLGKHMFKDAISNAEIKSPTHWMPLPQPPQSK